MRISTHLWSALLLLALLGCSHNSATVQSDHPRLAANVVLQDVTFHSSALNREMPYRVFLPAKIAAGEALPSVYLLHGGGGSFRDWSNYSDVAGFAAQGLILVMPEGGSSYYVNSAEHPHDRYEDYIAKDLISDVESRFPVARDRGNRAIVGVSMGGFGAVKLALSHPDLFAFAGAMSPALDVPSRPYSFKRRDQWQRHKEIFGDWGSTTRRENDPFVLVRSADPKTTPYLYLSCGEQEGFLPSLRQFAGILEQRHFSFEFHTNPGGHDWNQWNAHLRELFESLTEHY